LKLIIYLIAPQLLVLRNAAGCIFCVYQHCTDISNQESHIIDSISTTLHSAGMKNLKVKVICL